MYNLKVLTTAVTLLFVTPVLAQEMGGATGPGSASGFETTYTSGYYNGYGVEIGRYSLHNFVSQPPFKESDHCFDHSEPTNFADCSTGCSGASGRSWWPGRRHSFVAVECTRDVRGIPAKRRSIETTT